MEENTKKRLGKGLEAFFGEQFTKLDDTSGNESNLKAKQEENSADKIIKEIPLDQIQIAQWQPRKTFDEIKELADSIKEHGVLQPILLKKVGEKYEIIAGERRFRASTYAQLKTIPAIVTDFSNKIALEVSMIENLQRQDLNPIEKAEGFAFLIQELDLSQEALAKRLGLSRSVITNFLRINTLPDDVKEKVKSGEISAGHAKILANKTDSSTIAKEIVEKNLSVRDLEKKFKEVVQIKKEETDEETLAEMGKKPSSNAQEIVRFQEMIEQAINTPVEIELNKGSGRVILSFKNLDKLEDIIQKLCL